MNPQHQKIGWKTAAAIVIANMIGTGVFTSLGFQIADIQNTWSIILLWSIGGILALIGAFTYAELGTHFKESGGDYIFLSRIFHPFAGYLYAWISLTVGFSAPIAISALAMTSYLSPLYPSIFTDWFGIGVIILVTAIHSVSVGQSGRFQSYATVLKLLFVFVLIALGLYHLPIADSALSFTSDWQEELFLPGFAVSLIYVSYAYTGWNSAAYITDEIEDPNRNLPKALIPATVLVMVVYILLQLVFLRHASVADLAGNVEVATISFANVFGENGGYWVSVFIGIQLIATISGYLWVGSRISYAMAKENPLWKSIAIKNKNGIPVRALWLQGAISIVLTLTGTFEQVMLYASFALQLMGTLTVASLLWLKREKGTYHSPGRPWLQIVYILFSFWVLTYMFLEKPYEACIGLGFVVVGGVTYFLQPDKMGELWNK
ncbi:MAG: APC family permease [Chitinophagales bacterium]